jgi:hypothetical protein
MRHFWLGGNKTLAELRIRKFLGREMINKFLFKIFIVLPFFFNCTPLKLSKADILSIDQFATEMDSNFFFKSMMYPYFSKAERKLLDQIGWEIFKEDNKFVYYGYNYHTYDKKYYVLPDGVFKTNKSILQNYFPNYALINPDTLFNRFILTKDSCIHCKNNCDYSGYRYFDFVIMLNMYAIIFKSDCKFLDSKISTDTVFVIGIDKKTLHGKCLSKCF